MTISYYKTGENISFGYRKKEGSIYDINMIQFDLFNMCLMYSICNNSIIEVLETIINAEINIFDMGGSSEEVGTLFGIRNTLSFKGKNNISENGVCCSWEIEEEINQGTKDEYCINNVWFTYKQFYYLSQLLFKNGRILAKKENHWTQEEENLYRLVGNLCGDKKFTCFLYQNMYI